MPKGGNSTPLLLVLEYCTMPPFWFPETLPMFYKQLIYLIFFKLLSVSVPPLSCHDPDWYSHWFISDVLGLDWLCPGKVMT